MSKVVCPYCFESFDSSEVMFRCTNQTGCKKSDDPELHKYWGNDQMETPCFKGPKRWFGGPPESAKCPSCGSASSSKKDSITTLPIDARA